ncbi:MAG: hypothetical protein ACQEUB_08090 [Thermodesulfobacteriota bacterium]
MIEKDNPALEAFIVSRWKEALRAALNRNAGETLSGLVHNLHNYAHSLAMQMEMFNNVFEQSPSTPLSSQKRSLQRMTGLSLDFTQECSTLSLRASYTGCEPTCIELPEFLDWIQGFWRQNLFFKHHVQFHIHIGNEVPKHVHIAPGGLVYFLEEGMKNGLEALAGTPKNPQEVVCNLEVTREQGGLQLVLSTPTALDPSIDPWHVGSSTKNGHLGLGLPLLRICCREMGWKCRLTGDDQSTALSCALPL